MQVISASKKLIPETLNEIDQSALSQRSEKVKAQDVSILNLQKPKNLKLLIEAYGDCV